MHLEKLTGLAGWASQWAELLSAIGTFLAVVVALYLGIVEVRHARAESAREQDRLREERDAARTEAVARETRDRHAQALQLIGWVDHVEVKRHQVTVSQWAAELALRGFLANYSGAVVFDVEYRVHDRLTGEVVARKHLKVLPPSAEPRQLAFPDLDDEADVVATVRFRDVQGRRWRRLQQEGRLERLDDHWQPMQDLPD